MGKKAKVGKQRKDKFYHLAKETGYRSRAAFKLIQLNRKFEFLQKSRVLVDLCAAPGGWMQVAVKHMPVSSIVIGVDLFPIKPVAGTIAIQEDITSPRCLTLLKKEMKTWKADVVLNDGAPNVGQNWLHDAYSQNCLALSAFKLATDLLKPGGYFVTKVFRSKDYNSLIWVLQQFFKNVFSTKPAASRTESAEIFVVCKGYLSPHTIDPKFLDAKYVFDEIDVPEGKRQLQHLLQEVGKKRKPEGYPAGETLLYKPINASEFIRSADSIELLANTSEIILDEDWILKNKLTTQDIKDYCADVKVLGKKEIKTLVTWRKQLRDKLDQFVKIKTGKAKTVGQDSKPEEIIEYDEAEDEEQTLEDAIQNLKQSQLKEAKKKKKKLLKERRKIHEKTNLKMIIPGDVGPTDTTEDSLFTLKTLKSTQDVHDLTEGSSMPAIDTEELNSEEELELYEEKRRSRSIKFDKENEILDSSGTYYKKIDSDGDDSGKGSDVEEEPDLRAGLGLEDEDVRDIEMNEDFDLDEVAPISAHPLITDLDHSDKNQKRLKKAQMWFSKDVFNDLNDESDEDIELSKLAESYKNKGAEIVGFETNDGFMSKKIKAPRENTKPEKRKYDPETRPLEVVAAEPKKKKLDVKALALGTLMVESSKTRRDLFDDGWNRYAFNDTGLPTWFIEDEKKHARKKLPVPETLVEEYKKNLEEINARPIKKVVEAKARKKKRVIRKLEKAKKKAEAILEKSDVSESEKASQLKQLYKKAKVTKKKEVTYVVAKKFSTSKRAKRPPGVKGQFKVVDPRMKKDMRKMKTGSKQSKGKRQGGGDGKGKGAKGRRR